jgi:TolB-like protein
MMLKSILTWMLAGWTAAVTAPSPARAQADGRPGVAVFPFTDGGSYGPGREDMSALTVGIQQMLLTEMQQNPALRVVERSSLREVLEEQDRGAAGRVDAETAARVGRLVGARYAVTGAYMDMFGNFRLDARIVNVETGEVLRAVRIEDQRREHLYRLLVDMAGQVVREVNLPPLDPRVRQERRSRNVPNEATLLYSRALAYQENGRTDRAVQLYRQIAERFPDYTEVREALRQLEPS